MTTFDFDGRVERRRAELQAERSRLAAEHATQMAERVRLEAEAAARQAALQEAERQRRAPFMRVVNRIEEFLGELNRSPAFAAVFSGFETRLNGGTRLAALFTASSDGKVAALFRDRLGDQDEEDDDQEPLPPERAVMLRLQHSAASGYVEPRFRVTFSLSPTGSGPTGDFSDLIHNDQSLEAVLDRVADALARTVADLQDQRAEMEAATIQAAPGLPGRR